MGRIAVAVFLGALLCSAGAVCLAQDGYVQGHQDGRLAAGQDCGGGFHFARGLVAGPFYVGYVLLAPPNPPPDRRLNDIEIRSDAYQEGYIAGYEAAMQGCRTSHAFLGWSTWLLAIVVISAVHWP